ncbi:hypothetical protein F7734_20230 [Scytonema sp. UIC 10036]|uniref:hypothetical protein n=1 Tax=Scytonema sp. UIC 10036 TaxID=2304196 RepID=UPI0012DAAD60|nr:hypothetical protein [Scytonema sp. UIC 10036]MUG94577.1 hypothetical protein [Scytonema sp. UIC 10036]
MSNTYPERQSTEAKNTVSSENSHSTINGADSHDSKKYQLQNPNICPWVGIRQYTNQLSPNKANPGYVARARVIYDNCKSELSDRYPGWYVAIEPDSGDYFLDANKEVAQNQARSKHPSRLICTFQLNIVGDS